MVRSEWAKRVFDVVGATIALVAAVPVFLAVAVAVRMTSPGPVFFRQRRIGHLGRPIVLFKFRTMRVNDDSDTTWTVRDDRRLTPIGRLLRTSCLDELPQLVNVIRGDMSLVGPRPERPYFADHFTRTVPDYRQRLRVPAGLTGWAQIHGLRGDTSIEERVALDNFYIEHRSLRLDLVILARTVAAICGWVRQQQPAIAATPAAGPTMGDPLEAVA